MQWYWMSSGPMTVAVGVRDGIVRQSPAIVRKFRGQALDDLRRWMRNLDGEFREKMIWETKDG